MTEPVPIRNRLPSRMDLFATNLKQDIRAHQRTYEGAYTRTAIGCLSFSILIIKLFSKEFLPIGTIYTIYGCLLYFLGVFKSSRVDVYYNPDKDMEMFTTSGDFVLFFNNSQFMLLHCLVSIVATNVRSIYWNK